MKMNICLTRNNKRDFLIATECMLRLGSYSMSEMQDKKGQIEPADYLF